MTGLVHCQSLLLVVAATWVSLLEVEAFSPLLSPTTTSTGRTRTLPLVSIGTTARSNGPPTVVQWAKRGKDDMEEEDDDDDDDDMDDLLSDSDWRDFRAKLVMSESQQQSTSTSSSTGNTKSSNEKDDDTNTIIDTQEEEEEELIGDLDGIGSIFMDSNQLPANSSAITSSRNATSTIASNIMTPLDPSQWAYDSGKVIEQGAVILGGVEQAFGFGLRQQYFHKAAILVLDHEESTFTKGIILNRPTDLTLQDDINEGVRWRVWFGGDVQGLTSNKPDIVCLHSLKNEQATKASIKVMKDIKWTTFENAKRLVQIGAATPTDFWVFMGYAGWGAGQLMGELDRKSWYMVATDSQTLLKELARQSAASDPREAGLDTWELLMGMIGRSQLAKEYSGDFDDLMLKEWALGNLLSSEAGGGAGERDLDADVAQRGAGYISSIDSMPPNSNRRFGSGNDPLFGRLMNRMGRSSNVEDGIVEEGSVVRASSADRSPFLLEGQELHKSIVLVISDENGITVGAILNRPASKGLDIQIRDKSTGDKKDVVIPLRFGGQYTVKGSESLLWLHCSASLREAEVGAPVGRGHEDGIWKCTADDVISSIGRHLAKPEDFIVVSGVSIWGTVPGKSQSRGIQDEVDKGKFELVPTSNVKAMWNALAKQDVLTSDNLSLNLEIATEAWNVAGGERNGNKNMNGVVKNGKSDEKRNGKSNGRQHNDLPLIGGLGDGFDEEDDSLVFKSDVKVAELSDDALRSWVRTFLLGMTSMQG